MAQRAGVAIALRPRAAAKSRCLSWSPESATGAICPRNRGVETIQVGAELAPCSARSLSVLPGGSSVNKASMSDARPANAPSTVAPMTAEGETGFWVALSDAQVQELVQQEAVSRGAGRGLLGVLLAVNGVGERIDLEELMRDERYHDRRISQSVIRSLLVLSAFALGEVHGLNSLATELSMGTSTLWRYLKTWVVVGVLEERKDRRYQLAVRWRRELPKRTSRRSGTKAK